MSEELMTRISMLQDGNAWPSTVELINDLADRITALEAENERLREALKSFQELASEQAQELSRYRAKHMVGTSAAFGESHD